MPTPAAPAKERPVPVDESKPHTHAH